MRHISVLGLQVTEALLRPVNLLPDAQESFVLVDCTLGLGGHMLMFIQDFRKNYPKSALHIIGFDQDQISLNYAKQLLLSKNDDLTKVTTVHANFSQIKHQLQNLGVSKIDALLADLGVSSPQLDQADRGFSLNKSGPLDMRMNQQNSFSANEILTEYSETQLAEIFFKYGEEPKSRLLAKAIIQDRNLGKLPLNNTLEFADYVKRVLNYHNSKTHPATRIFQALRIEVNQELASLEQLLDDAPGLFQKNGVCSFITFHSLEDRIVKTRFRNWEKGYSKDVNEVEHSPYKNFGDPWGKEVPRGGIEPNDLEIKENPRSRSARLRVFQFAKDFHHEKN